MTTNDAPEEAAATRGIPDLISGFVERARRDLEVRWTQWDLDLSRGVTFEVIGALLARQVTLATGFAESPGSWNAHIAPLFLRAMADAHINLAWIIKDPDSRAIAFQRYGLGQLKAELEHLKAMVKADGGDPDGDAAIASSRRWLESQRLELLTEVNLGSWSGKDTRTMAVEAGCEDVDLHVFRPMSASAHSAWHQVGRLNLKLCTNPLHRFHSVPQDPSRRPDPQMLYYASGLLERTLRLFDNFVGRAAVPSSAHEFLSGELFDRADEPARGKQEEDSGRET